MSDLALQSATKLVAALRARKISSRELLDLYLQRIERFDRGINAVVTLDADGARRRADEADAALARGEVWGPLHGLPMTIKDTFEVAGMRTTAGAPELADHVPATDSVAAARLRAAGAVIFGKTNVPLYAGDVQSYNAVFGQTNNPWDADRTPGGSSGGAAAALASGFTAVEFGSDIGGSIRHPANWCGVYGHKPTWGIIPSRGHIPGPPGALSEPDLGVVGPLGRSAEDLRLILDVTAGPPPDQGRGWKLALPPPRRDRLQDYRVAAWLDHPDYPVDAEVRTRLEGAVEALRRAGVRVEDTSPDGIELPIVVDRYMQLVLPIILSGFPLPVFEHMRDMAATLPRDDHSAMARMARWGTETHRDWIGANEARAHIRAQTERFFEKFDVLLCPVTCVPAIPHDHSDPMVSRQIQVNGATRPYFDIFGWIALATMALLPASVAPVGRTRSGLPVGVQIVGAHLDDHTTIDFARRLGDVVGGFEAPPLD